MSQLKFKVIHGSTPWELEKNVNDFFKENPEIHPSRIKHINHTISPNGESVSLNEYHYLSFFYLSPEEVSVENFMEAIKNTKPEPFKSTYNGPANPNDYRKFLSQYPLGMYFHNPLEEICNNPSWHKLYIAVMECMLTEEELEIVRFDHWYEFWFNHYEAKRNEG